MQSGEGYSAASVINGVVRAESLARAYWTRRGVGR